jgi:hypothetical protein
MTTPVRLSPCSPDPKSGPRWSDDPDLAALQRAMRGGWVNSEYRPQSDWELLSDGCLGNVPCPLMLALVLLALPFAVPYWVVSGRRRRADLRRQLAEMPEERLPEVLRMLQDEPPGPGRRMTESILRQMGIPTEVSPAAPPEGRGDEPAAP